MLGRYVYCIGKLVYLNVLDKVFALCLSDLGCRRCRINGRIGSISIIYAIYIVRMNMNEFCSLQIQINCGRL